MDWMHLHYNWRLWHYFIRPLSFALWWNCIHSCQRSDLLRVTAGDWRMSFFAGDTWHSHQWLLHNPKLCPCHAISEKSCFSWKNQKFQQPAYKMIKLLYILTKKKSLMNWKGGLWRPRPLPLNSPQSLLYKTNRFHIALHLFSYRSGRRLLCEQSLFRSSKISREAESRLCQSARHFVLSMR